MRPPDDRPATASVGYFCGGRLARSFTCKNRRRVCVKARDRVQEGDETDFWLELLQEDCGINDDNLSELLAETNELIAIFVTMAKRTKANG